MGNWRTVEINGRIDKANAASLRQYLVDARLARSDDEKWDVFPLCVGEGFAGLWDWVQPNGKIKAIGNLAERDFDNDDIEKALITIAKRFPTLVLTLHSGDDYESRKCTATFLVDNGKCVRCKPKKKKIRAITMRTMIRQERRYYKSYPCVVYGEIKGF